jgi:hypothetical protein
MQPKGEEQDHGNEQDSNTTRATVIRSMLRAIQSGGAAMLVFLCLGWA